MLNLNRPSSRTRALLSLIIVSAMMTSLLISSSSALNRTAPPALAGGMRATNGTGQPMLPVVASATPAAETQARAREAGVSELAIYQLVAACALHSIEDAEGHVLVCPRSLSRRQEN